MILCAIYIYKQRLPDELGGDKCWSDASSATGLLHRGSSSFCRGWHLESSSCRGLQWESSSCIGWIWASVSETDWQWGSSSWIASLDLGDGDDGGGEEEETVVKPTLKIIHQMTITNSIKINRSNTLIMSRTQNKIKNYFFIFKKRNFSLKLLIFFTCTLIL